MKILLEILAVALVALAVSRLAVQPWRGRFFAALKLWLTVRAVWLLSVWPMTLEDGSVVPAWKLVIQTAQQIDARIFWTFLGLAVGVKLVGHRVVGHQVGEALGAHGDAQAAAHLGAAHVAVDQQGAFGLGVGQGQVDGQGGFALAGQG